MATNKKRLYIALYPGGTKDNTERKYHWAFLIGPKIETCAPVPGVQYHVKNPVGRGWVYEELELRDVRTMNPLLARILIAKIVDERRLVEVIRTTPLVQDDEEWRCRSWIAQVLERLAGERGVVGRAELSWVKIEALARDYVGRKTAGGRYGSEADPKMPKPTWDMLLGKETVP